MPRADIKTKQAVYTLFQLHAELAGKFLENERQRVRLKMAMMQVEAVVAAIHAALRKRNGTTVVSEGVPARWRLKEAAN